MGMRLLVVVACAATLATVTLLRGETSARPRAARERAPCEVMEEGARGEEEAPEVTRPRVVDALSGAPVGGARLAFHGWRCEEPLATSETDERGEFDSPEGASMLVVRAEGYPPTPFDVGCATTEFRLGPGVRRTLRIVDEDKNPCPYAEVSMYGGWTPWLLLATEVADARGVAELWLSDRETVLVHLPGFAYEEPGRGTEVVLHRGFSIAGKVQDSAGRSIEGARVEAVHDPGG